MSECVKKMNVMALQKKISILENAVSKPMFTEQPFVLFENAESGEILPVSYRYDFVKQAEKIKKLQLEQQFLEMICRDFVGVYCVNLKNDVIDTLKLELNASASKLSRIKFQGKSSYSENIIEYGRKYVTDANKQEFLNIMNREYLLQQLAQTERLVYRYESVPNILGQRFFEVQIIRYAEEIFNGNVLIVFRQIDDIVTLEQRYQSELEKIAYLDGLTELGNRAAFKKELLECESCPKAACIVGDLNNLKLYNDRYGHQEGDKVIIDAARCVQEIFGSMGRCYRIGGDEFCVLIRSADRTQILTALENLQIRIEEKNKRAELPFSIALGYAVRESEYESMEQLFNRGDSMMYDMKYQMKRNEEGDIGIQTIG